MQRVLLTATVRRVATTLLTQALEKPRLRETIFTDGGHTAAQAILRFGYTRQPGVPTTAGRRSSSYRR